MTRDGGRYDLFDQIPYCGVERDQNRWAIEWEKIRKSKTLRELAILFMWPFKHIKTCLFGHGKELYWVKNSLPEVIAEIEKNHPNDVHKLVGVRRLIRTNPAPPEWIVIVDIPFHTRLCQSPLAFFP